MDKDGPASPPPAALTPQATRVEVMQRESVEEELSAKMHQGDGVMVETRLTLGAMPKVELSWGVAQKYWGSTLLVFHSLSGFYSEDDPDDLSMHGNLIIETIRNGSQSLFLDEGTHYFTFLLRKKSRFFSVFERRSRPKRFSIMVPGAKLALSRIQDQLSLKGFQHQSQLMPKKQEIELNDAEIELIESSARLARLENPHITSNSSPRIQLDPATATATKKVQEFFDAIATARIVREEILSDPRFQQLTPEEQKAVLDKHAEHMAPGEITARRGRDNS